MSTGVIAALLSALLLLSPGAARAVAHVLAENGVTIPANVIRVLDTLPADPARDAARRDEESVAVTLTDTEATPENEPEPALTELAVAIPSATAHTPGTFAVLPSSVGAEQSAAVKRFAIYSPASPRAPPV